MIRATFNLQFAVCLIVLALCSSAFGQEAGLKKLKLEFNPVPGAEAYEIEIKGIEATDNFKVAQPQWSGYLQPGKYEMRMRTLDYRKVPGEWSPVQKFEVAREKITLIYPQEAKVINVTSAKPLTIGFRWTPIGKTRSYEIEVSGPNGFLTKETTKLPLASIELPSTGEYKWKVTALSTQTVKGEASAKFLITGTALESPVISSPANGFVRELVWSRPPIVEDFNIELSRKDQVSQKWSNVKILESAKENTMAFEANWPGGEYRLRVQGRAANWQPSPYAEVVFEVQDGARSVGAEEMALRLAADNRCNNWCGTAGYFITNVNYSSSNYDKAVFSQSQFSAVGGTGQIGLIKQIKNTPWGYSAAGEYSGVSISGQYSLKTSALEGNILRSAGVFAGGLLRLSGGAFYKEVPVVIGDATTAKVSDYAKASVLGPHFGLEYSRVLISKAGLQLKFAIYDGVFTLNTPNSQPVSSAYFLQYGILGSYVVTPNWTGFAGLVSRTDSLTYGAQQSGKGSPNNISIQGNYLNLVSEYNF